MNKIAFLFSGQGSQYTGMGAELLELMPDAEKIYECGSDILGFDLKKTCFEEDPWNLAKPLISQPTIFATSLVAHLAVSSNGINACAVAGHSLGEYAAMVASNIIDIETGFKIIKERAQAMHDCTQNQNGTMCAVMKLNEDTILKVCNNIDGYVVPVNYNSPEQTVIAGETNAVEQAIRAFTDMGKRTTRLNVTAAFHSKLMQPAAIQFKSSISGFKFNTPSVDFYSNITGGKLTDFSDMPGYLASHLVSPVRFVDELHQLRSDGIDTYIELGPKKVLSGFVKRTLENVVNLNVEDAKSFRTTTQALSQ